MNSIPTRIKQTSFIIKASLVGGKEVSEKIKIANSMLKFFYVSSEVNSDIQTARSCISNFKKKNNILNSNILSITISEETPQLRDLTKENLQKEAVLTEVKTTKATAKNTKKKAK